MRGRHKILAAAVAAGAFSLLGQPIASAADQLPKENEQPATTQSLGAELTGTGDGAPAVRLLAAAAPPEKPQDEVRKLDKSKNIERQRAEAQEAARRAAEQAAQQRAAAERQAADNAANARAGVVNSAGYVKPTDGQFTSGFGSRWGSSHNGIDLANEIGTPIYSAAAGEVINAGPASGFGQWIRVQHDDGTITVYGHINTIDASVGERVDAGEQIATIGNEGQSTGPHLHFEVIEGGEKIDPLPWLAERGLHVQ